MPYSQQTTCRICGKPLEVVLALGDLYPSAFLSPGEAPPDKAPLTLTKCRSCGLIQLAHTVDLDSMYHEYFYQSGINPSMVEALKNIVDAAAKLVELSPGDIVCDIACFPEAIVFTDAMNPKDISQIEVGDQVVDASGSLTEVKQVHQREHNGELVKIRVSCGSSEIRMTPEHPVLLVKNPIRNAVSKERRLKGLRSAVPEWMQADCIEQGDFVVSPVKDQPPSTSLIDLSQYADCDFDDQSVYAWQLDGKSKARLRARNQRPLPRHISASDEFARFLGLYVAEGSGRGKNGTISFALNENEREYATFLYQAFSALFNVPASLKKNTGKSISVSGNNALLKRILQGWFGENAESKHVPAWIFDQPLPFVCSFLRGYFEGDGCVLGGEVVKFDTVSRTLAYQVRELLNRMGFLAAVSVNPNSYQGKRGNDLYSVKISSEVDELLALFGLPEEANQHSHAFRNPRFGNYRLLRVNSVSRESFSGTVYNLETESHTYLTDNFAVHNCNDMSLLAQYPDTLYRVGFDPARNLPQKVMIDWFVNDYFSAGKYPALPSAKIVTSIAMFYDLPSPPTFVHDVARILDPQGVWIMQLNDLKSMIELNAVDAACHEHLEYYSIVDVMNLMTREGLQVFRVEHNDVNGGSLRFYIDWQGVRPLEDSVLRFMREEYDYLESPEGSIEAFAARVETAKATLLRWLQLEAAAGRKVYGLAASTKGNTLLQYFGIDSHLVQAIADLNPDKFGKETVGTHIPIVSEAEALSYHPDALLVLAWGFLDFFLNHSASMKEYLRGGGALIAPLPVPRSYVYDYKTGGVIETDLRWAIDQWEIESGD